MLSIGLARDGDHAPASAITSSVSFLPTRNSHALSTRNGRDATAPSAMRASSTVPSGATSSAAATPEHREIERAAAAQLPVGALPAVGRNAHRGEDLVRPARQVVDAVVLVEARRRGISRSPARRYERHLRAERDQRRRGVGRRDREAALARGRDPAGLAVLLHAEVDRLAPLVVLVVVVAARVEAEVAAERAHVAQVRRRDLRRRLPQAR